MKIFQVLAVALIVGGCGLQIQAQDAKQIVQQAANTELAADKNDHTCWIFHEVDRKPKNSVVQWVAQTHKGEITRVLTRNNQQISKAQQQQDINKFIHDPSAQAKQRQDGQNDDKQASSMMKLLPVAFIWTVTSKNDSTTTLHFKPDPHFQPPSRQARVFSAMEGDMTVNNDHHRIQELKGHLIHNVDFGYGLLGRLNQGGSFAVERQDTGQGEWQITSTHVHIQGHALIFKSISEQEDDVKTSFSREPDNVTLEQASSTVMSK
ncbi:hypothetical protein [Alloacidobacterium sp.]|uniref:hypothetical protein n=1 Tax=Alloacidobacterium sp. TaxID=2951999 RepID=UPI002D42A366|nr:hypothetical protein [Alloacidobacterium sp.]HYK36540.1 hypothetical protein [Alloacidobacterium sp.]